MDTAGLVIPGILGLIFTLVLIVGVWKIYTKAGYPGWTLLIPLYGIYVLVKISGKPSAAWLVFVPVANFFVLLMAPFGLAARFGKGMGFALGLLFLPFIFYPILGFGSSTYTPVPKPI